MLFSGHFSYRHEYAGSIAIRTLYDKLNGDEFDGNLFRILTIVNNEVATKFVASTQGADDGAKQMPSIVSMLTKELYFPPVPKQ